MPLRLEEERRLINIAQQTEADKRDAQTRQRVSQQAPNIAPSQQPVDQRPIGQERPSLATSTDRQLAAVNIAQGARQEPQLFKHDLRQGFQTQLPPGLQGRMNEFAQAQAAARLGNFPVRPEGVVPPTFSSQGTASVPEQTFTQPIGPTPAGAQPGAAPIQPEGQQNVLRRMLDGVLAGFSGQTPEGIRANRAQSTMLQLKARDAIQQQQAQDNLPAFMRKADGLKPFIKDAFTEEKRQAKIQGLEPPDRPTMGTFQTAIDQYQEFYKGIPGRQISPVDRATLARTERGRGYLLEQGILPPSVLEEVIKGEEKAMATERAKLFGEAQRQPTIADLQGLPIGQQQAIAGQIGAPVQQVPVPAQQPTAQPAPQPQTINIAPGADFRLNPPVQPGQAPVAQGQTEQGQTPQPAQPVQVPNISPPRTGSASQALAPAALQVEAVQEPRGLATNIPGVPATTQPGGIDPDANLSPFQRALAQRILEGQVDARNKAMAKQLGTEGAEVMTGAQANAEIRRRFGVQLNDPQALSLFDENEAVSRQNFESTADEFGRSLRASDSQEGRLALEERKFQNRQKIQADRANLSRELAKTKTEDIQKFLQQKGELKKTLQQKAFDHQLKRDQEKFSQQELRDQFKVNARLDQMREELQTKAGIAFTRDAINNDAEQAVKFALESQRRLGQTVRGVMGSLLKRNPGLGPKIVDRLQNGQQPSGETVGAVKGALEDYLKEIAEGNLDAELDRLAQRHDMTDRSKQFALRNMLSNHKKDSPEWIKIQDRLDIFKKKSGGITVNLPGNEGKDGLVPLPKKMIGELTESIQASYEGVELADSLLSLNTPITGPGGALVAASNFLRGTAYDLDVLRRGPDAVNVDPGAWSKFLDPSKFNTEIDKGRYLINVLRYSVARTLDPSGRLSDQDIERVNLGVSVVKNSKQLNSAVNAARSQMLKNARMKSQRLESGGVRIKPTADEKELVISDLLRVPSLRKAPKEAVMEFIQARLAKSDIDVQPSESSVRSIFDAYVTRKE